MERRTGGDENGKSEVCIRTNGPHAKTLSENQTPEKLAFGEFNNKFLLFPIFLCVLVFRLQKMQ